MNVLHGIETLDREAGGLPAAVLALTRSLPADVVSTIVTTRSDLSGQGRSNVIHQHGLWAHTPVSCGRFAIRRDIPLVISPHGMLEPWALAHHSWRKRIAWLLYQRANLRSARVLHAASTEEAAQFRALGLAQPIAVIPHGVEPIPDAPLDPAALAAPKPRRQALFLSRLHPKKGVDLLLRAWASIDAPDWELIVAGNDENGYRSRMESLARDLGLGERVRFAGPLYDAAKDTAFRRADLFVLPSHSENFGIAIAEALQYGVPTIATTGTPWRHLPEKGCGWCVEVSLEGIRGALIAAIGLSDEERRAMGRRGAALISLQHRWPELALRYRDVYRWLADAGLRPATDWFRL